MRSGKIVDRDSFTLNDLEVHDDARLVSASIQQYYELGRYLPSEIHVPVAFEDSALVTEWLSSKKHERVEIVCPKRGGKRRVRRNVARRINGHTNHLNSREEATAS